MKPATRSFYATVVQRVVDHVATHLDDAPALDTLARQACLSPFHFHRIFRGMVGETPLELARRLRLERAAWQLATTDRAVTTIAFDAGFETHEAFTRAFRSCYDDSPTRFRERRHPFSGPVIALAARSGVHFVPNASGEGAPYTFTPIDTGGRSMNVEITAYPELRVATVHHVGPYNRISEAFTKLGEIAGPAGLYADPAAAMVALYHDDPESTPAAHLQSDAGLIVSDHTALPPSLGETRVPAGRYARTVHRGPYNELGDVWARFLGEWLPASGHRLADSASYELYLNNPHDIPSSDYLTELRIPIEPE